MKHIVLSLIASLSLSGRAQGPQHLHAPKNPAYWFEIPVMDMARAVKFYNTVLGTELHVMTGTAVPLATFPADASYDSAGALIQMPELRPGTDGPVVYLNGGADLQVALNRVADAGGRVLLSKTQIPNVGYFAMFIDTEGNRLGLFSEK